MRVLREVKYPEYQALRKWKTTLSVLIVNTNTSILGKDGWSCPNTMWKERSGCGVRSHEFSSVVAHSCPTLFDCMDYSRSGFPVHHQIPELAQTHFHCVSDVIQQFHPLLSPSLLPSIFPRIRVFSNESVLRIRWPKYWNCSFSISPSNEYSGLISWLVFWLVWSPCYPRDSQASSPTPQFKTINSLALCFLYCPSLTSIHDYWKNHSFD